MLPSAFVGLTMSGCAAPPSPVLLAAAAGPETGGVLVAFSPTAASFDDEQAQLSAEADGPSGSPATELGQVWIDGCRAMLDGGDGPASPLTVREGGVSPLGYLEAGPHHVAIKTSGGLSMFDGDAEVPSGGTVRLFLFGALEALQGRFVSTPDAPASGNQHVTVVNLLRTGQSLEVVTCAGAAACTPISPVLQLGGLFDTEVPAGSEGADATMTPAGVGIGYRAPPSPSLPAPPVLPLHRGSLPAAGPTEAAAPAVFIAAPVYMSEQGQLLYGFD